MLKWYEALTNIYEITHSVSNELKCMAAMCVNVSLHVVNTMSIAAAWHNTPPSTPVGGEDIAPFFHPPKDHFR